MKRFSITTLGCKVNQSESLLLAQSLQSAGLLPSNAGKGHTCVGVDLCIINTCTVTRKAAMQSRQAIRQAIRANPAARVIVTGCYAQTEPQEIKTISGVDTVVGHFDKHNIPNMVCSQEDMCHTNGQIRSAASVLPYPIAQDANRTRPVLKIQDGCNAFCTYCIVPLARGRSRSIPIYALMSAIEGLEKAGFHEIVLSGIHIGCYGRDLTPPTDLFTLLSRIVEARISARVRLSSIEPRELTNDILKLVADSEIICRHFHIPLQSGDDSILTRMNRPYTNALFKDLVLNIHALMPDAGIGVDTLVGFPGETAAAFANTCNLIEDLPVTYLHVFPFSARKGTPAARFSDKVAPDVLKKRCAHIRRIGKLKTHLFYKKLVGKRVKILIESKRDQARGLLKGITSNYVPVYVAGGDHLKNTFIACRITDVDAENSVFGVL